MIELIKEAGTYCQIFIFLLLHIIILCTVEGEAFSVVQSGSSEVGKLKIFYVITRKLSKLFHFVIEIKKSKQRVDGWGLRW